MPRDLRPGLAGALITLLARLLGGIAALVVFAMCILVSLAIVTRYFFDLSLLWVPEIVGYLMVMLVYFGLAETLLVGRHIRMDIFVNLLPTRTRDTLEVIGLALSTAVVSLFTWHGVTTVLRSYEFGRKDAFGILRTPLYIPQSALAVGLAVLTLAFALLTLRKLGEILTGAPAVDLGSDLSLPEPPERDGRPD